MTRVIKGLAGGGSELEKSFAASFAVACKLLDALKQS